MFSRSYLNSKIVDTVKYVQNTVRVDSVVGELGVMVNINEKEKRGSGGGYTLSNSLQLSPMRHLGSVVRARRHALSSPQSVSH